MSARSSTRARGRVHPTGVRRSVAAPAGLRRRADRARRLLRAAGARLGPDGRGLHRPRRARPCWTSGAARRSSPRRSPGAGRATWAWTPTPDEVRNAAVPGTAAVVAAAGAAAARGRASVDVCYSSNVLEHVPDPAALADEMVRVTRPGGLVVPRPTPTGCRPGAGTRRRRGTTSAASGPAARYAAPHGHPPKNRFGESACSRCSVAGGLRWARAPARRRASSTCVPRYHPDWARWRGAGARGCARSSPGTSDRPAPR